MGSSSTVDPRDFLLSYQSSELQVAAEFFTHWLPFLSRDLCDKCTQILKHRVQSLDSGVLEISSDLKSPENLAGRPESGDETSPDLRNWQRECDHECSVQDEGNGIEFMEKRIDSGADSDIGWRDYTDNHPEFSDDNAASDRVQAFLDAPSSHMSWADMAQEDELEEVNSQSRVDECDTPAETSRVQQKRELPRDQREYIRFMNVQRKKDFICLERFKGKIVNILDGLELHAGVFSAVEQKKIVDYIYSLQEMGKKGELKERTYSEPEKWMRGKGRVTIQFGCCYNHAVDKNGNPPGILRDELVDPIPHLFKVIIKRLVGWHVLPPTCVPDSCIVNIYEPGDCILPHIDNHDFVRPFCSVSFLSECNILFGSNLRIIGPGEFSSSVAIPLPVGSVLVLNGNGADVAKHCIPGVPAKRISITFRKMDENKLPFAFVPEPDLQGIQPLPYDSSGSMNRQTYSKARQTFSDRQQEGNPEELGQSRSFEQTRFPRGRGRGRGQGQGRPSNRSRVRVNFSNS